MKKYLKENRVSFKEINIERDPSAARDVATKTGQTGVPVVKIGSKWIVGFDKPVIERQLPYRASAHPSFLGSLPQARTPFSKTPMS